MSPNKIKSKTSSVAVGGDDASEVTELRSRLDQFEDRHERIKSEFDALKTLNDQMAAKHEMELKDVKVDLRLAKRDVDKYKETNKYLREEKRELKDQMSGLNATLEELRLSLEQKDKQIQELLNKNDKHIKELSDKLSTLHEDSDAKQLQYKEMRDNYEHKMRDLNDETKSLKERLNRELNWKRKYEDSIRTGEQNGRQFVEKEVMIQSLESEIKLKTKEMENKDKELKKIRNNYKILQQQCEQMDKQAEQFKTRYVKVGAVKEKLIADKDSTLTEVQKLSKELLSVRSHLDSVLRERDDLMAKLEDERQECETIVERERLKLTAVDKEFQNERQKNRLLEERLSAQEQNQFSNDELIFSLDSKISSLEEQLIAIKEEAAKHITTIGTLKDTNLKLTAGFRESMDRVDELEDRIESLHHQLDIKEEEMNREKSAYVQQLAQQKKAIDHLQDTNDQLIKQKKPLFSITPTKKIVTNSQRQPNGPLNESNDLNKALAEEKANNRRLVEEINRLKGDANYFKNEVSQLKNTIKSDELSVKSSDETPSDEHLFRKPLFSVDNKKTSANQRAGNRLHSTSAPPPDTWSLGSQRMHHNIPHRFIDTTNKIPNNKCVSCAETIHFGRKAVKCGECGATTHAKCAQKLPNNCGLPVQMMQQLFHSSYEMSDQLAPDYYQPQRVDDVIAVVEPSAPEETYKSSYDDYNDDGGNDSSGTTDNNEPDSGAITATDQYDTDYRDIQDICDNKENDGFSFTDSLLDVLDRDYK